MNGPMQAQQPPVDPNALPPIDNWMSGLEAQQPAMPQQQAPQTPQNYLPQQYMDRISGLDNQRDAMMANTAGVFKKHPILSALGGFAAMGPVGLALPLLGGINQRERQMEVQKWYGDQRTALNNEFKDVILPSINYGTSAETANWYTQNAANMGRVGMSDGMGGIGAGMAGSDQGQGLAGGVSAQGQMQPMQFAGQLPTMMSPETAGHLMAQFGNLYSKSQEQGRQAGEFNAEAPKRQADVDKLRAEASKAAAEGRAQDALGLLRQAQVVSEKALAEERRASAGLKDRTDPNIRSGGGGNPMAAQNANSQILQRQLGVIDGRLKQIAGDKNGRLGRIDPSNPNFIEYNQLLKQRNALMQQMGGGSRAANPTPPAKGGTAFTPQQQEFLRKLGIK
jgi:hypothetical protein